MPLTDRARRSWNSWTTAGSGTFDEVTHNESQHGGTKTTTVVDGELTWNSISSGSSSGYTETTVTGNSRYDWNDSYDDGYFARTDVGYSAGEFTSWDREDRYYSWENTSNSDGSAFDSYTSGGSDQEAHTQAGSYSNTWTETYTQSSGSGSGGGSTSSTGGTDSGSWSSQSSASTSWEDTWTHTTPADPVSSGSGSGGSGGGGETVGGGGTIELDPWEVSVGLSDFAPPDMVSPGLKGDAVLSALDPTVLDDIISGVQFVGDYIEWRVQVELSEFSLWGDAGRGLGDSIGDGFEWVGYGLADWFENDTASVAAAGIFAFVGGAFRGAGGIVGAVLDPPGTIKGQVETGMAYYNATGSVLNGITGSLGMNDLAEAIVGTDIITGEQISGDERFDRAASGFAATLGVAAAIGGAAVRIPAIRSRLSPPRTPKFKNCFPAGTPVATPDGQRAIEKVQPGDLVWAHDILDSEWKPRRVLEAVTVQYDGESVFVTAGDETIESTFHHPYWVIDGADMDGRPLLEHHDIVPQEATTPGRWIDAGHLQTGDVLLAQDGRQLVIDHVRTEPVSHSVYNFEVEELHCYAVGRAAILVHNNNGDPAQAPKEKTNTRRKQGGKFTEPKLPPKTIAERGPVRIDHYTRSGDHGPPHAHVKGGGPETKIGKNGKAIEGSPKPTAAQQAVIDANRPAIRRAIGRISRWWRFENKL